MTKTYEHNYKLVEKVYHIPLRLSLPQIIEAKIVRIVDQDLVRGEECVYMLDHGSADPRDRYFERESRIFYDFEECRQNLINEVTREIRDD